MPGYSSDGFYQADSDRVLTVFSNCSDGRLDAAYEGLVERAMEIVLE